ncbi:MAG: hypothetical protein KDA24_04280 [Deltaproteobacteria bacterium]|nr:hypothetical protein [Deltaproteobacteria bacterium]
MKALEWTHVEHLAAAAAVAMLVVRLWPRTEGRDRRALLGAACLAAVPLLFVPLPAALEGFIVGKEGLVEVLTAGVLAGVAVRAFSQGAPWMALGSVAVLLEELDYGQWITAVVTPDWLVSAQSTSGNLNTHNLPGLEAAWRLVPLFVCVVLSLHARWPAALTGFAGRIRLPRLHASFLPAVVVLLVLAGGTALLAGGDQADEGAELAAVVLVALAWRAEDDGV